MRSFHRRTLPPRAVPHRPAPPRSSFRIRVAHAVVALACLAASRADAAPWTSVWHTPTHEIAKTLSSPSDSVCWMITNFDRTYRTLDGGRTWTRTGTPLYIPSGLFAVDGLRAFKCGTDELDRTTNGGVTWSAVFTGSATRTPEVWMLDATNGLLSYAGVLRVTTDGGTTWTTDGVTQPPGALASSFGKGTLWVAGDDLWAALANGRVAHSPDLGQTWTLPANAGFQPADLLAISFANDTLGIAVQRNLPYVYVTTDGAEHWTSSLNTLGANQDVLAMGARLWFIPNPADHFYLAASTDAGVTWTHAIDDPNGFEVLTRSRLGRTLWAATEIGDVYVSHDDQPAGVDAAPLATWCGVAPNPARAGASLSFALAAPAHVELTAHDVAGRRVARIAAGTFAAGAHAITWSGRGDDGRPVPPGLYLLRLDAGARRATTRLVVLQ